MTALVVYLQNTLARLRERQEGQTMAEYALILGGIAVVVIAGILILGPAIRDLFQSTGSSVTELPELVVRRENDGGLPGPPCAPAGRRPRRSRTRQSRTLSDRAPVPMMGVAAGRTSSPNLAASCGYLRRGNGGETNRPETRRRRGDDRVCARPARVRPHRRRAARLRARLLLLDRGEPPRERDGALGRRRPEPVRTRPDAPAACARQPGPSSSRTTSRSASTSPDGARHGRARRSVRVRVQKPFSFVPILGIGTITIRGTSTMRIERLSTARPATPTDLLADMPEHRGLHVSRRCATSAAAILVLAAVMIPVFLLIDGARRRRRQLVHAQAPAPEPRRRRARSRPASSTRRTGRRASRPATPRRRPRTAQEIADVARQYAGDPEASDYASGTLPPRSTTRRSRTSRSSTW